MKKFRVLSDLHLDINEDYPLEFNDDTFTIICGDTAGYLDIKINWIKDNIKNGVGVSGNHLPYNYSGKIIQDHRNELAKAFPRSNSFTYLDCETDVFYKEVDGILFIGTCMYTNMSIKHPKWNPTGDISTNMTCSELNMNDYRFGIKRKEKVNYTPRPQIFHITAKDYAEWFNNAYNKIENKLNENEALKNPLPVVLITHHPLITDFLENNTYLRRNIYDIKEYNWPSYASDMKDWLLKHSSIKCYCSGHIHEVTKPFRTFYIQNDTTKILIVNNVRGYITYGHGEFFNKDLFVNTETWEVEV